MNNYDLFNKINKLPKPLSTEELHELFYKMNNGNEEARDKIIMHNIRLVISQVIKKFGEVEYDKSDLVSVGNIGLIKAVKTFDVTKNIAFATYAVRCINNEIIMFLRKSKINQNVDSLDRVIISKDGNDLKLEDIVADDENLAESYENKDNYKIIREFVNKLPYKDRQITMLYFGFYDNKTYTQKEIADKLNVCQPHISRIINKVVKNLGQKLKNCGVIELSSKDSKKKNKVLQLTSK